MADFRYTALGMVNDILSAGDSEVVSEIQETEEAQQVLRILNRAITQVTTDIDWEHKGVIVKLDTATGTDTTWNSTTYPALPWVMKIPTNVESVYNVFYNQKPMVFVTKEQFQYRFINQTGLQTDGEPKYYTSWDDQYFVFNNFDSTVESQLSSANSECLAVKFPSSDLAADTDIPNVPDRLYIAILNKSLQLYFQEIEKDLQLANMKRQDYTEARSKLMKWAKRNKAFVPYNYKVDFSRQIPGPNTYLRPWQEFTDLGPN